MNVSNQRCEIQSPAKNLSKTCFFSKSKEKQGKAIKSNEKFVIAIPGTLGSHSEQDHEQVYCYFNNESIFANEIARDKKIAILDLNSTSSNGTINNCANKKNIQVLSLHVDENSDPNIYHSKISASNNIIRIKLDPGTNGKEYVKSLIRLLDFLENETEILLVLTTNDPFTLIVHGLSSSTEILVTLIHVSMLNSSFPSPSNEFACARKNPSPIIGLFK